MLFLTIDEFRGEYSFLSNFYPAPFVDNSGLLWATSEHYYQAHKTNDPYTFDCIRHATTPGISKKLGANVELRGDWNDVKIDIMKKAIRYKFDQNLDIKEKLILTGEADLIEGNRWGDTFWGYDLNKHRGKNVLGNLLIELRQFYRDEQQ